MSSRGAEAPDGQRRTVALALAVAALFVLPTAAFAFLVVGPPGAPGAGPGSASVRVPSSPVRPLGSSSGGPFPPGVYVVNNTPAGAQPTNITYDPANGLLYVTDFGPPVGTAGNSVTIINSTDNAVVGLLGTGDDPISSTYDPADGYVYINDFGTTHNLTVVNGVRTVASIQVGDAPRGSAYDAADGDVFVASTATGNVSVVNGTSVVATIPTGGSSFPCYVAYDPQNQLVYVADSGTSNVTVFNGTTTVANIATGGDACDIVVDPVNDYVYVPTPLDDNVTVLDGTDLVGTVNVGSGGQDAVLDGSNGELYVANEVTDNVSVISGATLVATLPGGGSPRGGAYDSANGFVYIENWLNNCVSVYNGTTPIANVTVGTEPYALTYAPDVEEIDAADFTGDYMTVIGDLVDANYTVTFNETGLPAGTEWNATLNGTTFSSSTASIGFPAPNGTENYSIPAVAGYYTTPTGTVTVSGANVSVNITFGTAYAVTFEETGLPPGLFWSVDLGSSAAGSSGPAIGFFEPNGTYDYAISPIAGYVTTYSGQLVVNGSDLTVPVDFLAVGYTVAFHEVGLPAGDAWSVIIGSTETTSATAFVNFTEANGTYRFTVLPVPDYYTPTSSGSTEVRGGNVSIEIDFELRYPVLFTEVGLAGGTFWTVAVPGVDQNSSSLPSLALGLPNGTFTYDVTPIPGYYANWTGTLTVAGPGAQVTVSFTVATFPVEFIESGLPTGSSWSVDLAGATVTGDLFYLTAAAPNGTQPYTVVPVAGYTATPASGEVTVSPTLAEVMISFARTRGSTYPVAFVESGLAPGTNWSVRIGTDVERSSTSSIDFLEPNGTVEFTVLPVPGYTLRAPTGTLTVNGSGTTEPVVFAATTYAVMFDERNLAAGTTWGVAIGGVPWYGTTSSLEVEEPNGTFSFVVLAPPGPDANRTNGTFTIDGASPGTITIAFSAAALPTPTSRGSGTLPLLDVVLVGLLIVVLAGCASAVLLRRRRAPPREGLPPAGEGYEPIGPTADLAALPEPEGEYAPPSDGDPVDPMAETPDAFDPASGDGTEN